MNLANRITIGRLALVPFFMGFLIYDHFFTRLGTFAVFVAASALDLYDGYVARRTGTVTMFGTFLDPLVDKLFIAAAFIGFVGIPEIHIPAWMVVLIIGREFLITGLRSVAAARGILLSAEKAGKFKTSSQVVVILMILAILIISAGLRDFAGIYPEELLEERGLKGFLGWLLVWLPYWLVFLVTIFTLLSGYLYLRKYRELLRDQESPSPSSSVAAETEEGKKRSLAPWERGPAHEQPSFDMGRPRKGWTGKGEG